MLTFTEHVQTIRTEANTETCLNKLIFIDDVRKKTQLQLYLHSCTVRSADRGAAAATVTSHQNHNTGRQQADTAAPTPLSTTNQLGPPETEGERALVT